MYGFKLSLTLALDEVWVVNSPLTAHLPQGKRPILIVQEAGCAPGPSLGWRGICRLHRDSIPGPSIQ